MLPKNAVVFGAGKIARGFIGHLLAVSGYRITFVEKAPDRVALLRRQRSYEVHIMGAPEKDLVIGNYQVISTEEPRSVAERVAGASVIFVSIGGPNLPQIVPLLAAGVEHAYEKGRTEALNVILCENDFQPAQKLTRLLMEQLRPEAASWLARNVGIVETMVLRSVIEPAPEMRAEDPLSLNAQDMWELPADKQAFAGEIPPIKGLAPKDNFQGALIRKLYTYNSINAMISYSGYLKGYQLLSDAAHDLELVELARASYRESSSALCQSFGFDPPEQLQFAESAIAKYQKREIADPIERNARDPIRKLGRYDRLVGPACLALEYQTRPVALSRGIAAALRYDHPGDPSAQRLQALIRDQGLVETIREVCGIEPRSDLTALIVNAFHELEECGLGRGDLRPSRD